MPGEDLIRAAARQMRSGPDAAALRRDPLRIERAVRWADTERDPDRVQCPTLILQGERDQYFPDRLVSRFINRLPNAAAHTLAGCGHSRHDDCHEQAHPLITRFPAANIGASAHHHEEEHDG